MENVYMRTRGKFAAIIRPSTRFLSCLAAVFWAHSASAQLNLFPDRDTFEQVLGSTWTLDDFHAYSYGGIVPGTQLGDFVYNSQTNITIPAIIPDGDFKRLGGVPYRVFVGGDRFTLANTNGLVPLNAFGLDISYAPAADTIPTNTFTITLLNGPGGGLSIGNPPLPSEGGSFFLGFVANPGIQFSSLRFNVVQRDPSVMVPASQINDIVYRNGTTPQLFYSYAQRVGINNFLMQGGGGMPGGRYVLFFTSNLSLPLSQWAVSVTNHFDSNGNFSLLQATDGRPRMFFLLKPD